jgi:hypothetical protein
MIAGPLYDTFLACRDCGTLVPIMASHDAIGGLSDEMAASRAEFLDVHGAHRLLELKRTETESASVGPVWDPMSTHYVELTDGVQLFVATSSRPSIDEGRVYTFEPCALRSLASEVEIAENDVRRGLDLEFYPHAVRPTKVDDFLNALHAAIRDLALEDIEIAFADVDDPAVSIAPMPEQAFQRLLAASTQIFDAWEIPHVERFLRQNRLEDGVLALRVRRNAVIVND